MQYDVQWMDSVGELKGKICKNKGIVGDAIVIVYDGLEVAGSKPLHKTGVLHDENPTLHLYNR